MLKVLPEVTLNASTFTAITVPLDLGEKTYILQCDSAIDVTIANNAAGTDDFTIKSGTSLAFKAFPTNPQGTAFTLCYAKAASSTPDMEILMVD